MRPNSYNLNMVERVSNATLHLYNNVGFQFISVISSSIDTPLCLWVRSLQRMRYQQCSERVVCFDISIDTVDW